MDPLDVATLGDAALDALPVGVVELAPDGRVARYNQAEARRAGVARWRVLGRDFFRDVAWTLGAEAAARIRAFHAAGPASADARFRARAPGRAGSRPVEVTLIRAGHGGTIVLVAPP